MTQHQITANGKEGLFMNLWKRFRVALGIFTVVNLLALSSVPASAAGIEAFSNQPSKAIVTPNDAAVEARKTTELAKWQRLQEDFNAGKLTQAQFLADQDNLRNQQGGPARKPAGDIQPMTALSVWLNIPAVAQVCKEYCGPASTYEVLAFSGVTSRSQSTIAADEGTGACTPTSGSGSNAGTCNGPIRDELNQYYQGLPYANFYITTLLDHSSLTNAYNQYSSIVDFELSNHTMPFIQLLDPKTCDGKAVIPGWETTSSCGYAHYITTTGYNGLYNGAAGSRTINFDDTAWWTAQAKSLDLQNIAYMVYDNNGSGSCNSTNIVY